MISLDSPSWTGFCRDWRHILLSTYKKDWAKMFLCCSLPLPVDCYTVLKNLCHPTPILRPLFIPSFALLAAWEISRLRSACRRSRCFSCLWSALLVRIKSFAHQSFAPDDFTMLKRANAACHLRRQSVWVKTRKITK